jgi:SAM-dependent methyltransferase
MQADRNPFSQESKVYSQARPHYPVELYEWMASKCVSTRVAWDCATGNGQAALGLASFFAEVQATDISGAQITNAFQRPNIVYSVRSAEASDFAESSFDLIVVAQALHWFDFVRFWPEVSRVARPGALFCAWGYSWFSSTPLVDATLLMPFRQALEPFWALNNRILWEGYQSEDIAFPYVRMSTPPFEIQARWTLEQLIEYMCTWSAYKHSRSDPAAVEAVDSAVARVRNTVAADEQLPIRMPLKLVAGRIMVLPGGTSAP